MSPDLLARYIFEGLVAAGLGGAIAYFFVRLIVIGLK